jgi:hypothetical protein
MGSLLGASAGGGADSLGASIAGVGSATDGVEGNLRRPVSRKQGKA